MLDTASETPLRQKRLLSFLFPNVTPLANPADRKEYPARTALWLLRATFWWTVPVMKVGYTRTLEADDMFRLSEDLTVEHNTQKVVRWLEQVPAGQLTHKTLARVLVHAYWRDLVYFTALGASFLVLDNGGALITRVLIQAIEDRVNGDTGATPRALGVAVASSVTSFLAEALAVHYLYATQLMGIKLRLLLTVLMMEKAFRLSPAGRHRFPLAKILLICTTDLARVEHLFILAPFVVCLPVGISISIAILAVNLGLTSIVAIAMLVVASVSLSLSVKKLFSYRASIVGITDARVKIMKEIVLNLKMIKFYNWEAPYFASLMAARVRESKIVMKIQTMRNFLLASMIALTPMTLMVLFVVLHALDGAGRLAASIFSSVQLFALLLLVLAHLPICLSSIADLINAFKRVAEVLSQPEIVDLGRYRLVAAGPAVLIRDGTFVWETFDEKDEKDDANVAVENAAVQNGAAIPLDDLAPQEGEKLTLLDNINLQLEQGEFVVVTGAIGSGKTSLLNAIAGFMTCEGGLVDVHGLLILCGEPWILNTTVRENILFGSEWDHDWYDQVIYACLLQTDLDNLAGGDLTEVGEKGITLSGGQKARICLARAVYANKDIILMDDVLSAVDARVGKHIMNHLVGGLLEGKTRVLATHQLALVQDAKKIVFLNGDGSLQVGTFDELSKNDKFTKLLSYSQKQGEESPDEDAKDEGVDITEREILIDEENPLERPDQVLTRRRPVADEAEVPEEEFRDIHVNKDASKGKITTAEEKAVNSLTLKLYKQYVKFGVGKIGLPGFSVVFLLVTTCAVFTEIFSTTWLSFWVSNNLHKSNKFYAGLYVMFNILFYVFIFLEFLAVASVASRSLRVLNVSAAKRLLNAPMSFLDVTPVGRILNRFTKDTDALDNEIADNLKQLVHSLSYIVGLIILNVIYVPWVAISIPVLFVSYVGVANYYQASSREVKRLEAVQRSFVINSVSETLFGMKTIKSFAKSELFLSKTEQTMNNTNEATFISNAVSKWMSIQLQIIASSFGMLICVLSASGLFHLLAAAVGMLVNNVINMATQLSAITTFVTQVENDMNSAERLIFYADKMPQESNPANPGLEPAKQSWPKLGKLEFDNVTMLYRPGLPLVLKGISFQAKSGERIGICGRTGAGKSSIMAAIYRLYELESGAIVYDNMDISRLSLDALRSNLSIIPQDPALFTGTIRKNLDPFAQHSDDELWDVLRRGEILSADEIAKERARPADEDAENLHKFHLDQLVSEDGSNYSLGERQLISFARALVRNSRILILDEATSSVDYETDHKIQTTINREFAGCTILCIAHRLKTILHYDRIMTMDKGEIVEFGTPWELFQADGIFRLMCERLSIRAGDFKRKE